MARKRVDPAAKQKRQKMIAIGGLVLLAGLLALQGPKTMKMLNPPSNAPEAAPVDPAQPPPVTGVPVVPVPSGGLTEAPLVPEPGEGQLVSFELFESKDPFRQQVKVSQGEGGDASAGAGDAGGGVAAPPTVAPPQLPPDVAPPSTGSGSGGSSGGGSTGGSGSSGGSSTAPGTAVISVNGVEETVLAGKDFPADDPLFTLVRLTTTSAEIAVAGGSYQDGKATVTIALGKTLTLMNTTDGARYEIRLVSVGASTND